MSVWGNIRNKVKKLGSSSRFRSSRVPSASRDDMSVDSVRRPSRSQEEEEEAPASPAVPRPYLKIRVLTLIDQIVVRTDYEWDAHKLLKKQSYGHTKQFDTEFLMMTGLHQDMNYAFLRLRDGRASPTSLNQHTCIVKRLLINVVDSESPNNLVLEVAVLISIYHLCSKKAMQLQKKIIHIREEVLSGMIDEDGCKLSIVFAEAICLFCYEPPSDEIFCPQPYGCELGCSELFCHNYLTS
ncbi:uncharacterized protein LOC120655821 [Panicum virgatum]|uniref:uncharacterized protein LOC120655821 n=1 Tax=Panicum virgatum TaxID=38727 RepID=UPI0019D698D9|nr:uncharacterized protein LOC120655821 [Panicum virgatum]